MSGGYLSAGALGARKFNSLANAILGTKVGYHLSWGQGIGAAWVYATMPAHGLSRAGFGVTSAWDGDFEACITRAVGTTMNNTTTIVRPDPANWIGTCGEGWSPRAQH